MSDTIHNEDCFKTMKGMEADSVDCVFTSPPYNRKRNDKYKNYDDHIEDYYAFLTGFIDECVRISKGVVFVNIMKNYYNKNDVYRLIGEYRESICELFCWEKENPLPASGNSITNTYEFILCFGESLKSNTTYTKNHLSTPVAEMFKEHKAVMHKDVAMFFISNFTQPQDIIYDPFMGTGTTALVCKELDRRYIGSELSEQYCGIAQDRLSQEYMPFGI